MTRAGFPPTSVFGGTSLVTTEPAATTEFSPTVTPPMMIAPAAIQYVPLDHDRPFRCGGPSLRGFKRMARGDDADVRPDQHVVREVEPAKVIDVQF